MSLDPEMEERATDADHTAEVGREIIIYTLISGFSRENRKLSGKFTFPRGFETLLGPISSRA